MWYGAYFAPYLGSGLLAANASERFMSGQYGQGLFDIGMSILPAISKLSKPIKSVISNKGFAISNASGHDIAWIPLNRKVNSNNISNIKLGVNWNGPTEGELGIGFIESGYPGEGRKLYDAAIKHANRYGYDGIISGEHLVSAPKTYRTYQHYYPDRKLISNTGYWENINMRDGFLGQTKNAKTIDEFMMLNDNGNAV
jgi:hypothetical protein